MAIIRRDEMANSVTHGIAALASLAGLIVLIIMASLYGNVWAIVSVSIYGITLVLLFLSSTLYHIARSPRLKEVFHVFDHASIFLLIAGTYTPITLATMHGPWAWSLFGCVWGIALLGIAMKIFFTGRFKIFSTCLYVAMGWLAIIAIKPIIEQVPRTTVMLIAIGGVIYTLGVIFYVMKKLPYNHAIWHLFVFAAAICHYTAIMLFVLQSHSPAA